jgi:hypothetical protein
VGKRHNYEKTFLIGVQLTSPSEGVGGGGGVGDGE